VISVPNHIFDSQYSRDNSGEAFPGTSSSVSTIPDQSSSLSFPPDRLSMHGTWCAKLESLSTDRHRPTLSHSRIIVAVCRRSGLLQIFDNEDVWASPLVECQPTSPRAFPIWQANGCSHGTAILGQGVTIRRPEHHEVEVAEIRFFIAGPSLQPESISGNMSIIDEEKDSWMLRSLCILVDTSQGDLHLYSGSKGSFTPNRLDFSRVPLFNVSRPSDEAARHLIKLRRKGIVSQQFARADFRANRLHRFCDISGEDGLFAATPRPLWFVSERGAPTVVSHKSRHVSPAGSRPVPVSGFCTQMPAVFQNARNGFITIHERIGRVGSQRLTLYNGLWDVFAPHGLIPGGGISVQKVPLGVTVRHIEVISDFMNLRVILFVEKG
jgi:cleavage and polyadenylation specificity factor subunit 1